MPEFPMCPHCGRSLPLDPGVASGPIVFGDVASGTVEMTVPVTWHGEGHGSLDDAPVGPVVAREAVAEPGRARCLLRDSDEFPTNGSAAYDPLASPIADPLLDVFDTSAHSEVAEDPASWPAHREPGPEARPSDPDPGVLPGDAEGGESSWFTILLGSYASALTIAVAWLLWHGYGRGATIPATLPVPSRASHEERLKGLTPLGADHRVALTRSLTIGDLKITPISLAIEPVMIESTRPDGSVERTGGGEDCLVLRLLVENLSAGTTFAPIEPSAIRQPDRGEPASFIEQSGSIIENYPLAVASERSIRGQSLGPLTPRHHITTMLVSEPGARGRLTGPALWRLPVRVSEDRTVTIGIEIRPEAVH